MSTSRPGEYSLGYSHPPSQPRSTSPSANNSPIEPPSGGASRPPFGLVGGLSSSSMLGGNPRSGAGSPSHDLSGSSRLFSKRAREIQAQEGVPGLPLNPWGGPPTSGNSTPLRENIPESPTDGFPDFAQLPTPDSLDQPRRARAGTLPSRFSPGGIGAGHLAVPGIGANSARNTPSQSPYNKSPSPSHELADNPSGGSALLSRLRAGSMPQRSQFAPVPGSSSPFGPSIFSSWNPTANMGRERGSTLASIASVPSNGPSSPSQSQFSKEGGNESDVHMRTLDYLGLAETPQPVRAQMATPYFPSMKFHQQASRIRSYSVNNKDLHADEYPDEDYDNENIMDYAALQDQIEKTQLAIRQHNIAVQAFANQNSRRRARTAGVLDAPHTQLMNSYFNNSIPAGSNGIGVPDPRRMDDSSYDDLSHSVASMSLDRQNLRNTGLLSAEDQGIEGPTNALWLGNIPTSTTTSTLQEMFKQYGKITSARVLTHKNCGFVNFELVESAISAKANMNNKEIFPGASSIRINFAKPVSPGNTPGHDGAFPSPSPDPFAKGQEQSQNSTISTVADPVAPSNVSNATPPPLELKDIAGDILEIVKRFDATEHDNFQIRTSIEKALAYDQHVETIPPIRDPQHERVHDAPKLRELRKRIDNQSLTTAAIEDAALEMVPEIAELSSDYLGNTVVQKLFDHCSDEIRDAMLEPIAPHLAEIGCHKNGTWAAQRIIDVCKTPEQMRKISESVHPYTIPLFLDQFGNYVVQCCLKFGVPYTNFIFETMMSHMKQLSEARFGARAMRACLENHSAKDYQTKMLAAQIAIHGAHLATDQNGALLLTWYLDTCTLKNRRIVLAPRLIPYLVHLCTHKVAYLTVLKVINQKNEDEARQLLLKGIFFTPNDEVLEAILRDSGCGATLIFKVLTTPWFDQDLRPQAVENIKNVLQKIKAQGNSSYKRLMEEVGLSSLSRGAGAVREANGQSDSRQRPSSRHSNVNGHQGQQGGQRQFIGQPGREAHDTGFEQPGIDMAPAGNMPPVAMYQGWNPNSAYAAANGVPLATMNAQPQMPYQPLAQAGRGGVSQYGYAPQAVSGYYGNGPQGDQFRAINMPNGNSLQDVPMMPTAPVGYNAPPGYSVPMAGNAQYGGGMYNGNMGYGPRGQQGQGGRRPQGGRKY